MITRRPKDWGITDRTTTARERAIILTKASSLSHNFRPIKSEGPSIMGLNSKEFILKHCSIRRPWSEGSLSNSPSSHKPFPSKSPKRSRTFGHSPPTRIQTHESSPQHSTTKYQTHILTLSTSTTSYERKVSPISLIYEEIQPRIQL